MIKEVYGVYEGSIYEDGGVGQTLYKGKGVALKVIEERVEELQSEHDEVYKDEKPFMGLPYQWKEKEKGYWTNGFEVIKLMKFEVK